MNNPTAIVTKTKKKLRVGQAVFNKKSGIYEWQIKEGGRIVHREDVELMRERVAEEKRNRDSQEETTWKPRTVTWDAQGNRIDPEPYLD